MEQRNNAMRLEFHAVALVICIILFLSSWLLGRNHHAKPYFVFVWSFCGALLLPAIIPGHGEFIVAFPNLALLIMFNSMDWGVGLFYFVINFFISYAVLNAWQKYQNLK